MGQPFADVDNQQETNRASRVSKINHRRVDFIIIFELFELYKTKVRIHRSRIDVSIRFAEAIMHRNRIIALQRCPMLNPISCHCAR